MQIGVVYTNTDHVEEVFLGRRDGITECRRRRADGRQAFMNTERTKTSLTVSVSCSNRRGGGNSETCPELMASYYIVRGAIGIFVYFSVA